VSWWTDIVWPRLDVNAETIRQQQQDQDRDVFAIEASVWPVDADVALSEAHLIAEREDKRRSSTDGKASSYLLVIAALVPLLTYLESAVWEHKFGTAPQGLSIPVLGLAVLYVLGAAYWSFKTLTVGRSHTIGTAELGGIWASANGHKASLINTILANTRRNSDLVNVKVSSIMMAHNYLRRSILFFGLLLLLQVGWYAGTALSPFFSPTPDTTAQGQKPVDPKPPRAQVCDAGTADQQATKVMNDAFGNLGIRGDARYWARQSSGRGPRRRSLGNAWTALRNSFDAIQKLCPNLK
jgi:hypothetical protein